MKDSIRCVKGRIKATLQMREDPRQPGWVRDPGTGLWLRVSISKNIVVLAGLSMMAKSIQYGHADSGKTIRYMAVGSGTTAPTKSDTALGTEQDRNEINEWDNTDIASDPVVMIASGSWGTTEANAMLAECGLFQESSGAPMFARGLFGTGTISNATQASPVVITSLAHGLSDGDYILIENVAGMTELNNNKYYVDVQDVNSLGLYSDVDLTTPVDGSGYGAYSEASPDLDTWKLIIPKTASTTLAVEYTLTFPAD